MNEHQDIRTDEERDLRLGFPEIVYGEFKSADQIARIIGEHDRRRAPLLITRLAQEKLPATAIGDAYDPIARTFTRRHEGPATRSEGSVGVVSAGSSDRPVVAETLNTLSFLGIRAASFQDVGVAGIHRLLNRIEDIRRHDVLIVVAGFEGALPSVVAGLLAQPVIAVPTSVGYGIAANGHSALNAMLSSCANGVLVTNIDNGFGAAMAAARMLGRIQRHG